MYGAGVLSVMIRCFAGKERVDAQSDAHIRALHTQPGRAGLLSPQYHGGIADPPHPVKCTRETVGVRREYERSRGKIQEEQCNDGVFLKERFLVRSTVL
jgi:hypothetical protein